MASVRKLRPDVKNLPWVVEYTDANGKRRRETPKSGMKKDALALRTKIEAELSRGHHIAAEEDLTVAEVARLFVEGAPRRQIWGCYVFTRQ